MAARQVLALLVEVRILAPQLATRAPSLRAGISAGSLETQTDQEADEHHRQAHPEQRKRLPDLAP